MHKINSDCDQRSVSDDDNMKVDLNKSKDLSLPEIDLRVDPKLGPSVLRTFLGSTPRDDEVDRLNFPAGSLWIRATVFMLRFYRRLRPKSISQRCVFDPSCSRYAELAFRNYGMIKGGFFTIKRLHRCRPGAGGVDLP